MIPCQFQKLVVSVGLNGSVGVKEGVGVEEGLSVTFVDGVSCTEVGVRVNVGEGERIG